MQFFTAKFRSNLYFYNLVLLALSIVLSRFTMSVFQFTLLIVWLWWGFSFEVISRFFRKAGYFSGLWHSIVYLFKTARNNIADGFTILLKNKAALLFVSLYLMHIAGLMHTSDIDYALKDLRIKLPLLLLPVVLVSLKKISWQQLKTLLLLYVLAIFINSMFSLHAYISQSFTDIRQISLFINPIRFGLNVVFGFFILLWFVAKDRHLKHWQRALLLLVMTWFVAFLIILESMIGVLSLFTIMLGIIFVKFFKLQSPILRLALLTLLIAMPIAGFFYVKSIVDSLIRAPDINFELLPTHTQNGNPYVHDTINYGIEDGTYIGLYLSVDELREAWDTRGSIGFDGLDLANQHLKFTLIRYLNSRNLTKDSAGVAALTDQDIKLIEKGVANFNYINKPGLRIRISKIITGYRNYRYTNDPSGSSVFQRIEYNKASVRIIKDHFWFGVGTGDLPAAFEAAYKEMNTALKPQFRWRSHNQYMAIFIAFGFFGFLWFLIILAYPFIKLKQHHQYFYCIFMALMLLSMLTEDTIESQDGATLFAFFNALLLFAFNGDEGGENQSA
jgi:hypothetical protein